MSKTYEELLEAVLEASGTGDNIDVEKWKTLTSVLSNGDKAIVKLVDDFLINWDNFKKSHRADLFQWDINDTNHNDPEYIWLFIHMTLSGKNYMGYFDWNAGKEDYLFGIRKLLKENNINADIPENKLRGGDIPSLTHELNHLWRKRGITLVCIGENSDAYNIAICNGTTELSKLKQAAGEVGLSVLFPKKNKRREWDFLEFTGNTYSINRLEEDNMAKTYDELLDAVLEAVEAKDSNEELMEEGTSVPAKRAYDEFTKKFWKDVRNLHATKLKEMNKLYEAGNYAEAKKVAEDILKEINEKEAEWKKLNKEVLKEALKTGSDQYEDYDEEQRNKKWEEECERRRKKFFYGIDEKDEDAGLGDSNDVKLYKELKKESKLMIAKCNKALKKSKNIDEAYTEYLQEEYLELMTEGVLSNPLKKHLEKLKKIKSQKPAEYDGPEEIKKFVDANYKDIEDAAALLEKEPEDLRANQLKQLAAVVLSYLGMIAGASITSVSVLTGTALGFISAAMFLASVFVPTVVAYCRASNDRKAMDELSKVRDALAKVRSANGDKLPKALKNKVTDLITKIDDAETEINARFKTVKESADEVDIQISIYESAYNREITDEERDSLLSAFNEESPTDGEE